jgi:hypothetical protein
METNQYTNGDTALALSLSRIAYESLISKIAAKYNLDAKQSITLDGSTTRVIFHEMSAQEFIKQLQRNLSLEAKDLASLVKDVNKEILHPLKVMTARIKETEEFVADVEDTFRQIDQKPKPVKTESLEFEDNIEPIDATQDFDTETTFGETQQALGQNGITIAESQTSQPTEDSDMQTAENAESVKMSLQTPSLAGIPVPQKPKKS